MMRYLKYFALCALFSTNAYGAETTKSHSTANEWSSPSIVSTGGIGSLSDTYVDVFFSDPSHIANNKRKFILQWFGLSVNYSKDLLDTVSDVTAFANTGDASGNEQIVKAVNVVKKVAGRRLRGGTNINVMSLKIGGFSMIPYVSASTSAIAQVPDWPRASAVVDTYGGVGLGYAFTLGKNWDLGMNVRPGTRVYATVDVDASTVGGDITGSGTSSGTSDIAKMGMGFYFPIDMAAGFNPNKDWRFSLVMRDVAGASPLSHSGDTTPPTYPMRLSLGTTWTAYEKGTHRILIASELQDMMNLSEENGLLYRMQFAGAYKYRLPSRADTSIGLNVGAESGYPAGGVFLDLVLFKVEAALFQTEGSVYPGQKPVTNYALKAFSQMAF